MNLSFTPDPRLSLRADCRDSLKKLQCAAQQQQQHVGETVLPKFGRRKFGVEFSSSSF